MIAAAPAVLDAASATSATPAPGNPAGAAGFDAILLLQTLAGTPEMQGTAALDAGDTQDLLSSDESDDDDTGEDLEASLAFLSALLTATTPKGSPGDFQAGTGGQGSPDDGAALSLGGGDAFALNADTGTGEAEAALNLLAVKPETLEHRHAGEVSQNLARAAEILAQGQRAAPAVAEPSIATHVRDPRWADDFSARVSLQVRAGESTATLALTPMDLGPVEVNVTVKDSQATIHFGATQADTRAAIEASLPKLRELLASQGFNLLDASVSSGFSRSQQQAFASGSRASSESEVASVEMGPTRLQLGLLDLYA